MPLDRIHVVELSRMGYAEALELQQRLVAAKKNGDERDFLLFVEHPPVVTVGRGGDDKHLRFPREALRARGVEVFDVERGGDVTFHGPGQVVGYPILALKRYGLGVHEFLRLIEQVLIDTVGAFRIDAFRREGLTGVWTEAGKIAAIGIAVSRWISFHGFALNVGANVSGFEYIVPCGLSGERVTSIQQVAGAPIEADEVKRTIMESFSAALGVEAVWSGLDAVLEGTKL